MLHDVNQKAIPELASPQEQVDVKQVILRASHWFLLRGAAWGASQELVVAVTGSVPVLVTGSRYGKHWESL